MVLLLKRTYQVAQSKELASIRAGNISLLRLKFGEVNTALKYMSYNGAIFFMLRILLGKLVPFVILQFPNCCFPIHMMVSNTAWPRLAFQLLIFISQLRIVLQCLLRKI